MSSPIARASVRVQEFMDEEESGNFISDADIFIAGFHAAIQAVREEFAADARARRARANAPDVEVGGRCG